MVSIFLPNKIGIDHNVRLDIFVSVAYLEKSVLSGLLPIRVDMYWTPEKLFFR